MDDSRRRVIAVPSLRVAIVGGGIGGLCLAHGLKRSEVAVTVYERTQVRDEWLQGYRIHINPHGASALKACLPNELWMQFLATAGKPAAGFGFFTEHLDELLYLPHGIIPGSDGDPAHSHHSVSRIALRQLLLDQLEDVVRFGGQFLRYEQNDDSTMTAHFGDGTSAGCDVLIAADGANSVVRRQYLPNANRIDTGVVAVAGKLALTDQSRSWLPKRLASSVTNIVPAKDSFLFVAVWEGDRQAVPMSAARAPSGQQPTGLLMDTTQDYLFWAYATGREHFPGALLDGQDGHALQRFVASAIAGWHSDLHRMVTSSDPLTVAPVIVRSMTPVPSWPASPVTLIGDAIHNMTPMAGIGANTALRDAALLRDRLAALQRGEADLLTAIQDYEQQMLRYGFEAGKLSLRNARRATSGSRLSRAVFRAMLRTTNAIPPLKRQFARRIGS